MYGDKQQLVGTNAAYQQKQQSVMCAPPQPCSTPPPSNPQSTSDLSAECSRMSGATVRRLVTLRSILCGDPLSSDAAEAPSPAAINDHLSSTVYSLRIAHDVLGQIAASLGYEV